MPKKIRFIFILLVALILMGQGCIGFQQTADEGGVYRSVNMGDDWDRIVAVLSIGEPQNIGRLNISDFIIDSSDSNAIYALTNAGVYFSYDGGNSWQKIRVLENNAVNDLVIDYDDKCNIYIAIQNKIYKSTDCGRNFNRPIYDDPRQENRVNSIDVDSFNSLVVYAGTSEGDLLKSLDGGRSWRTIQRFDGSVEKVLIDQKNDTRIIYAATKNKGVYKSMDSGETWTDSRDILKQYRGAFDFRDLVYQKDHLILATRYGLFKATTDDNWANWEPIDLITAPGSARIYSLAVNPQDSDEIYYGTSTTFYRTGDGGETWTTKKLPSSRAATALAVHPEHNNVIYLGVSKLAEEDQF